MPSRGTASGRLACDRYPQSLSRFSSINMSDWEHVPFQKPSIASQVSTVGTWWLSLVGDRFDTERQSICFSKWLLLQLVGAPYVPGQPQNSSVLPCWPLQSMSPPPALLANIYIAHPLSVFSSVCLRSSLASQYDITPYLVPLSCLPFPPFSFHLLLDMYM